jgi:glyoxylase-like metal-dependent hydrolase (beta-lactamase superfamily II)
MDIDWIAAGWEPLAKGTGRRRLPHWDATVGLVTGPAAALLVDTGSSLPEGTELRTDAERLAATPVTHIALTHPHFDHVLGTACFPQAQIYGAAGLGEQLADRAALHEDAIRQGLPPHEAAEAMRAPIRPHHELTDTLTLDLGGGVRPRLVNVGPGHTGHDLAVLVPATTNAPAVVFCGDLVEESGDPMAGPDAHPALWPGALDRLLALGGPDARYVPGHGAVVDAAFVRRQRDRIAAEFGAK